MSGRPRRIPGHALVRASDAWRCKCGAYVKTLDAGRALARDVHRFHVLDVWMAQPEQQAAVAGPLGGNDG